LITEKISDLITTVTFTLNPIFTYISPSHKKSIGYEASDLIGKPFFDFVHPDDKRKLLSLLKKYISAKAKKLLTGKDSDVSEKVEIRFRDKSGNWRYMETTVNLIGNEIVSVSRDVTDRRKAEEELRLEKDRLQSLMDGLNQTEIGVDIVDMDYKILSQNQFLKKRFGDCAGKLCYKEYMKQENPCDFCPMEKAIKSGKVEKVELIAADGRDYELLSAPLPNPDGTVDRVIEVVRDITERKWAEERTKRQNEINILRAEIWELAAQPLPEDELIQQLVDKIGPFFNFDSVNFMKIYPEEKAVVVEVQWQNGDKSGLGVNIPLWVLKRSVFGKPYFVASLKKLPLYARPIIAPFFKKYGIKSSLLVAFGDIDNPEGYIVASDTTDRDWSKEEINIFTEVVKIISLRTEKKKAEEELKESHELLQVMNSELERKVEDRTAEIERLLEQKDEFIGQLGHDLKNPLGPLINLLPLLEKNETDPEAKETFEMLNRNARHMKNLVANTIELARLNSPNVKLNIEDINLMDELNNVIKRNSLLFEENNIEIENKADKDIIVKTDKLRLTELFDNLIGNSVKYSPDGGTVTIDTKQDKNFVTVSVKDTGMGMTEEQLSHMFDEFYKADEARHDFDSSGLGLAICKRIVEKHGGKIWAESQGEGKGTTMFFTLPMSSKKADDGKID
jgi:PAS domain S-box-containing protein